MSAKQTNLRRGSVGVIAVSVAVFSLAAWARGQGGNDPTDPSHPDPKAYVQTLTTYPTVNPDIALHDALAGVPSEDFVSARLGDPARDVGPQWGTWLYSTVQVDSSKPGASAYASWESDIVQGAVAEHLVGDSTDLAMAVSNSVVMGQLPDGTTISLGGGAGDVVPGQQFSAQANKLSDEQITASVNQALAEFGLTSQRVEVLRPLGPAVAVWATVDDVAAIKGKFNAIEQAILGDPYQYEGLYLELDSPDGTALVRVASSYRTGSDALYVPPENSLEIDTFGMLNPSAQPENQSKGSAKRHSPTTKERKRRPAAAKTDPRRR